MPDAASVKLYTCSLLTAHYGNHKAVPSGHACVRNLDDPDDMSVLALTHVTKPTADDPDE